MADKEVKIPKLTKSIKGKDSDGKEVSIEIDNSEIYRMMDKRDEDLIVAQLQGQFTEEYVYEYENKSGNIIRGLSIVGITEAARQYGGLKVPIEKMKLMREKEEIQIIVEAIDSKTDSSALGASAQTYKMYTKRGTINDPFYLQKCLSKAQRNAKKQLIPQDLIKEWIEKKKSGAVRLEKPEEKPVKKPNDYGSPGSIEKAAKVQQEKYDALIKKCKEAQKLIGEKTFKNIVTVLGYTNFGEIGDLNDLEQLIKNCRGEWKRNKKKKDKN